jgi:threonine dehydratase
VSEAPTYDDVVAASLVLAGRAVETPLLESPLLNDRLGGRLLIKAEMLQRTGSFKYRGAFNRLAAIFDASKGAGVVAYSSGNHAQGVAAAARDLGLAATVVMPADAPAMKIERTRAWGAEVVLYDRRSESREEIGERLAAESGATLIRPYDDPYVIAGQGTVGLELSAQVRAMGADLDAVLIPCGGGGLTAGCALAVAEAYPRAVIYTVEPAGFDDTARSLAAGERQSIDPTATTLCDALMVSKPGAMTFEINRRLLSGGLVVDDGMVTQAMAVAFAELKLIAEPGGAAALAAAVSGAYDVRGKTVAVVCSGGNVAPETFKAALDGAA